MFPLRSFRARKAEQCFLLLRRLNVYPPCGLNPSQNLHQSSIHRGNCKYRTSASNNANVLLPRTVSFAGVSPRPLCFSSNAQGEILDEDFSETANAESVNGENNTEEGTVEISSSESTPTLESLRKKPIDELFKDAVGLSQAEGPEQSAGISTSSKGDEVSDKPSDLQEESLKHMVETQWQIIYSLKQSVGDLKTEIKRLKSRNAYLEGLVNAKDKKKSAAGGSHDEEASEVSLEENESPSKAAPSLSSIFATSSSNQKNGTGTKGQEKGSAVKRQKPGLESADANGTSVPAASQKSQAKKKALSNKSIGLLTGSHPWPEWASFVEYLNEGGYLSKAANGEEGLSGPSGVPGSKVQGIIKSAAVDFAKDHEHIAKLLSGDDLKKVALFGCPSVEKKCIFAGKRLRSFFSIEEEIACRPCTLKDECSAPFAKVSKEKNLALSDIMRLLCIFGLNAGTGQLSISDEVRPSVLNLLKEVVNFSTNTSKGF